MDLYTFGLLVGPILAVWITWRIAKRRFRKREMTIFPPDRRHAVHVLETKDIEGTF